MRTIAAGHLHKRLPILILATCVALALAASVALDTCAAPPAQQDTWADVERIVAVGDVHGDHEQFLKALRAAEVIDAEGNWAAGKTHLVQTGDVLDRGPDSRKALDLLMKLEAQAEKAGGRVHALIGNHEAMVLLDDLRYLHPGELESFGGKDGLKKAMSPEGAYGKWIRSLNSVIKINDTLFVHGGLPPDCAKMSLREINDAVRKDLQKGDMMGFAFDYASPLWDRSLALSDEQEVSDDLNSVLKHFKAARIVVGHCVTRDGVEVRAGGRVIRIDVGMCEYYGGPAACLVIEKGVLYEVRHAKPRRKLEPERPALKPAARRPLPCPLAA